MKIAGLILFLLVGQAGAATYYVDFDGGSDSNAGTSTGAAWKHCQGDTAATGTAASTLLSPGDIVNFKGGVVYRSSVLIRIGGTSGSRITYRTGPGWGTGLATISGADAMTQTWTNCTSASDCYSNANWANIWYSSIPASVSNIWHRLYQDGETLHIAQQPSPSDPFNWDRIAEEWANADATITRTSLTNAAILTNAAASFYNGSWVGVWVQGNLASLQPITNYTPAAHSIGFSLTDSHDPYTAASNRRFTILNHPKLIDAAGEYAVMTNENRIYLWAKNSANPNSVGISTAQRTGGFYVGTSEYTTSSSYLTFTNLILANAYGHPVRDFETEAGGLIHLGQYGVPTSGTIITNCVFRDCSSPEIGAHLIYIYSGSNNIIAGNSLSNSFNRGVCLNGGASNSILGNVHISLNGTMTDCFGVTNLLIEGNTYDKNTGTHANAITAYSFNRGVVVRKNKVTNCVRMLTFQECYNLSVENNIFDGSGFGSIHEWDGYETGFVRFLNNTIINGEPNLPTLYLTSSSATYLVQNNIISGLAMPTGTHTYNLYTGSATYIPALSTGEATNTLAAIVPSYASGNYMIASNSASGYALDRGTDASAYGYADDYAGNTRSGTWDLGAFEYGSGGGGDVTAPTCAITSPTNNQPSVATSIAISGTSSDDTAVASVTLTNVSTATGFTVTGTTSWSATATLAYGSNYLRAIATDSSGNKATNAIAVLSVNDTNTWASTRSPYLGVQYLQTQNPAAQHTLMSNVPATYVNLPITYAILTGGAYGGYGNGTNYYDATYALNTNNGWRVILQFSDMPTNKILDYLPYLTNRYRCWMVNPINENDDATVSSETIKYYRAVMPTMRLGGPALYHLKNPTYIDALVASGAFAMLDSFVGHDYLACPLNGLCTAGWWTNSYYHPIDAPTDYHPEWSVGNLAARLAWMNSYTNLLRTNYTDTPKVMVTEYGIYQNNPEDGLYAGQIFRNMQIPAFVTANFATTNACPYNNALYDGVGVGYFTPSQQNFLKRIAPLSRGLGTITTDNLVIQ